MNITGTLGADSLTGSWTNDFIEGLDGNDTIYGGTGNDTLKGGSGDDTLNGDAGVDSLYGGDGNDTLYLYASATSGSLFGENGDDKLYASAGNGDSLDGGAGNDELYLFNAAGSGILIGGDGDDALNGGTGNDTLDGGTGNNVLYGDDGNDTYIIRSRTDYIYDTSGADRGTVYVDFYKTNPDVESWTWAPGVQKLPYWIDALLPGSAPLFPALLDSTKTVYFAFPTSAPAYFTGTDLTTFQPFSEQQKALARQALTYISTIVDLHFVETSDASGKNTIVFYDNQQSDSNGYGYYPSTSVVGSDIAIDITSENLAAADGTYAALTLIHELGHALGLKHTFSHADASGDVGEGPYLPAAEESTQWSVMSYTSDPEQYHIRYSPFDIAALQYLYGPSKEQATNDTYKIKADSSNFIWDGGGTDLIDGSDLTQAMTLYLEPGYWGYVGSKSTLTSAPGQIQVNFGTTIENAIGAAFNDTIIGNAADNSISGGGGNDTLTGGAGNDTLDGGLGTDIATYSGVNSGYVVRHTQNGFSVSDKSGAEGSDALIDIEQAVFADGSISFEYNDVVQSLYIAYFGRAADPLGLANFGAALSAIDGPRDALLLANAYATNSTVHTLVDAFGSSKESTALYSGDTRTFVTAIYNNILNRAPASEGLDFWSNAIDHSGLTRGNAALSILAGALSNSSVQGLLDAALVRNKISIASNFTFAMDTAGEIAAYIGSAAAANVRSMLATVTNATDVDAFQPTIDSLLESMTALTHNTIAAPVPVALVGISDQHAAIA